MAPQDDLVEIDMTDDVADVPDKGKKDAKKEPEGGKKDDIEIVEADGKGKGGAAAGPTSDAVVEKLKKDLETERSLRVAAEKKARDEATARAGSENEVASTNMQLVTTAIETTKRDTEVLEAEYAAALAAQDYAGAAKINTKIGASQARLLQLENGKQAMENEAEAAKKRPATAHITDPVEKMAAEFTPESAAWLRAHPEYARNPKLTRAMIRAHEDVMDDGKVGSDTPEYFAAIEKKLGLRDDEPEIVVEADADAAKATGGRRAAPPAAPVSHSGAATGGRPKRVTLTMAEVEAAESSGLTPRQYWENKQALIKSGRLN